MAKTSWANIIVIVGLILVIAAIWEYGRYTANYDQSSKTWAEWLLGIGAFLILAGFLFYAYLRSAQKKR